MRHFVVLMLLSGCYLSHEPLGQKEHPETVDLFDDLALDGGSDAALDDLLDDLPDSSVVDSAVELPPEIDAGGQDFLPGTDATEAPANSTSAPSPVDVIGELGPILYETEPNRGCTNRDKPITLYGTRIHWEAVVTITYPYDEGFAKMSADDLDECNTPLVNWSDITEISFRTYQDLNWSDGGGFTSGQYLVRVTNPDGQDSNEIGLNLQWCDEPEIPLPCQQ